MTARLDDPQGMKAFEGRYFGGKALLVLGGNSGAGWKALRDEIEPDVILGANGTCFEIDNLDFHLVVENLHMAAGRAARGEERYQQIMEIISPNHNAKVRLYSFLNWKPPALVDDRIQNVVQIKRMGELGDDYEAQFKRFSFRSYGDGLLAGPLFDHPGALTSPKIQFRIGTVATQLLHLAGVLGCAEVHTIGMDFCFKGDQHHSYKYPNYQPDKFRTEKMFTEYEGIPTMWDWVQGARWLQSIEPLFVRDGLQWIDHSHGLFEAMRLFSASPSSSGGASTPTIFSAD